MLTQFGPNSGPFNQFNKHEEQADNYYSSEYNLMQSDQEIARQEESKHLENNFS